MEESRWQHNSTTSIVCLLSRPHEPSRPPDQHANPVYHRIRNPTQYDTAAVHRSLGALYSTPSGMCNHYPKEMRPAYASKIITDSQNAELKS